MRQVRYTHLVTASMAMLMALWLLAVPSAFAARWPTAPLVSAAQQTTADCAIHRATQQYQEFYDYSHIAARKVCAASNQYRQFYDSAYIAAREITGASNHYRQLYDQSFCSGG